MTALYPGADGIRPGLPLPAGTKILAAYIGAKDLPDPPDAFHVWTVDECNLYLDPASKLYGGPELRILPIFVHDFTADPVRVAANMADAATDMGWSASLRRIIMLDLETLIAPEWVAAVKTDLAARGFRLGKYGSSGYVNHNPPVPGGTWMALLTGRRPTVLPPGTVGQQWAFGANWDLDMFSQVVYDGCGQGPRKARP
jgi:hypothetical protein